ncbi:MAG: LysR family transcriptional regulator [Acidiphilium sp. 37-64-53]|uniref:LysR family transcriptional regulator n=1 Tax=Acidiphilium TaxID=522 RepID=UPI000BC641C1|nr:MULTISPECIES: LysR family transcriptional regulator [Acidiphilium]OYW01580.1 MAG: LysR family transcriptional regulator [Acidiphilium sp. 37-64-53]OZB23747.1 MAG: LysR family transcriptional regulator [Acidiphilium sp. 34-64-41]HQT85767.1 LysR family transcriptional regulator [Acidiphilium rubrum]
MLDGISLDQLRVFITAADEGSFSAAGRKLRRAQSVVSDMVSTLEGQIGVTLFDRTGHTPKLTGAGTALLGDARTIMCGVDGLKARAKGMARGLEPELSAVIDVFFPMTAITAAARAFRAQFPGTPLRLYVEALGAAGLKVVDGSCSFGVVGSSLPLLPPTMTSERLDGIEMVLVASPAHPLASLTGTIPRAELARHVQLVLTDRSDLSAGREFGVISPQTWRLADLYAKHEFLRHGLGFGGMPLHSVTADLANGALVRLTVEDMPAGGLTLPMAVVYPSALPPGPAGRWLIEFLKTAEASASFL